MALNAPYTPNTIIQSTQVSNDLTGLSSGINDTSNNSMATFRLENFYDFVASGCVWSGDSYNSTRNGSQTSGVVYIAGVRLTVAAVSAHVFTASKDTYVDINGSGAQVYTEATNNAASPALTAGSQRIAIIITGASSIVNSGSVNQGQETIVLPIASSIAYSVTDSLGNLICCRDPDHSVIGYRQVTANQTTTSASYVDLTGLSVPVIIPTGRKIRAISHSGDMQQSASGTVEALNIVDATAAVQLNEAGSSAIGFDGTMRTEQLYTAPASGARTFKAQFKSDGVHSLLTNAGSINPLWVRIDLS